MSKQIERLLAKAAGEEEEKKDPETPETPADGDETPKDGEPNADGEPADGDGKPAEETPSEEAPADNPGEEAKPKKDGDEDDEAKALAATVAENIELKARVSLLEKAFKAEQAETARLRAALADPSFAAAAMKPQEVGAAVEAAAKPSMSREEAEKRYSALKDPKERADFRAAHADILGLKAR